MDRIIYLLYIYLRSQVIIFVTWDIFPPRVPYYRKRRLHSHVRYITLHYDVFMLVRSTNPNKEETFPLLRSIPDGRKAGTPEKKKENSTASFTELGPSIPRTCLKLIIRWNEFKTASERWNRFSRHWSGRGEGIIICGKAVEFGRTLAKPLENGSLRRLNMSAWNGAQGAFQFGIEESEPRVTGPRTPECIFHPAYNIKGITYRRSTASYVSSRGGPLPFYLYFEPPLG